MPLAPFALATCLAVSPGSDRITAADLAPVFPGLANLPPETALGLAPSPGVARVFHPPELRRIAARFGLVNAPDSDICLERPVAALDPAKILAAMKKALPEASIRILDFSHQPAPQGEIEFPCAGLHSGTASDVLWMGAVRYAGTRRFTIWARVQVLIKVTRIVAAADLPAGKPISPGQIAAESREGFPPCLALALSANQVIGKWPRVPIRAGSEIRLDLLEIPQEVMRGDIVEVFAKNGGAHLKFEARAEGSGALGQAVLVRNPQSNKLFSARVKGKDKVSVGDAGEMVNP